MSKKSLILINLLFVLFFFTPKFTLAQEDKPYDTPYVCPDFKFTINMQKGDVHEDVFVLQQILNLDKRTLVAQTGIGSKGNETGNFGTGTREALKRFQALFIEYIEVADGKFNTKTRTVMNNICQGPFFTGEGGNVYDVATNTDVVAPIIGISGPTEINLAEEDTVKVYIAASEAIRTPSLAGLIIDGGMANDIRKTSATTFSFSISPNEDVKDKITIQFEADSMEDLAGNKNEAATNEWEIRVIKVEDVETSSSSSTSYEASTTDSSSTIDDILNAILGTTSSSTSASTSASTDCSTVGSISIYDYSNPCYGRTSTYDPNSSNGENQEKKKEDSLGDMLKGLMQGLMQALSGMKPTGGSIGGDAACGCTGLPTASYSPKGPGVGGRQITLGVVGGGSDYVGKQGPPPAVCGMGTPPPPTKGCTSPDCRCKKKYPMSMVNTSACCGTTQDITGQLVTGTLAPSPTGMRSD